MGTDSRGKDTCSLLVPAMLNFMSQVPNVTGYDYSTLRWIQSGAAPLPENLIRTYADWDIEVHQIYGLTEVCGPACVINAENALKRIGSTGQVFFHTEGRVVDENGIDCQPGEQGEIWIRVNISCWNTGTDRKLPRRQLPEMGGCEPEMSPQWMKKAMSIYRIELKT